MMAAAFAVVAVFASLFAGYLWYLRRPPCLGQHVIVRLEDDTSVAGVLWRVRGRWLEIRDKDESIIIDRRNVLWLQVADLPEGTAS